MEKNFLWVVERWKLVSEITHGYSELFLLKRGVSCVAESGFELLGENK